MIVIIHATMYDKDPIQTMHIMNVIGNSFFKLGRSQSGMVSMNRKWIGHNTNHIILRKQLFSFGNRINEYPFGIISTSITSLTVATSLVAAGLPPMSTLSTVRDCISTSGSAPFGFLGPSAAVTLSFAATSLLLSSMCVIFFMFPFCWKCSMDSAGIRSEKSIDIFKKVAWPLRRSYDACSTDSNLLCWHSTQDCRAESV